MAYGSHPCALRRPAALCIDSDSHKLLVLVLLPTTPGSPRLSSVHLLPRGAPPVYRREWTSSLVSLAPFDLIFEILPFMASASLV